MSIDKFNDSVFSQIMESNDSGLLGWARNVYSKIKGNGILPEYIEREKEDDFINISVDPATYNTYLEDNTNFTFGKCISGQDIPLSSVTNLGTAHTIRFEVSSEAFLAFKIFSDKEDSVNYIYVKTDSIVYKCGDDELEFTPVTYSTLSEIVIERDNLSVRCTVNGIEIDRLILTQNNEFYFDYLIETTSVYTIVNYGQLYNWYAAVDSRAFINGWRIPTTTDINNLISNFASGRAAYLAMREVGLSHWSFDDSEVSNSTGFTAKGSGIRETNGLFHFLKNYWTCWGARDLSNTDAIVVDMIGESENLYSLSFYNNSKYVSGLSIRLMRDYVNGETIPEYISDYNGNNYAVVKIGNQLWMAENLVATRYNNGDSIPEVTDNTAWGALTTGACCAYNNDHNNI